MLLYDILGISFYLPCRPILSIMHCTTFNNFRRYYVTSAKYVHKGEPTGGSTCCPLSKGEQKMPSSLISWTLELIVMAYQGPVWVVNLLAGHSPKQIVLVKCQSRSERFHLVGGPPWKWCRYNGVFIHHAFHIRSNWENFVFQISNLA